MWKKSDTDSPNPSASATTQPQPERPAPKTSPVPGPTRSRAGEGQAVIGPSLRIQGTVGGEEDLLIEGRVDGEITLPDHSIVIGSEGRVKAEVRGRTVTVEGEVEGNVHGTEQVLIKKSGQVIGDVRSPRVALENGARFKGSIDMSGDRSRPSAAATTTKGPGGDPRPEKKAG